MGHLVFIDETATSTNMIRTRGRAQRGTRLTGRVPHGHWKITTFVAGLRCGGITAPFVIDRPMNGAIFLAGACPGEGRGPPVPGPDPGHGRHRRHGQSQLAQGSRRARGDRSGRRHTALPATLLPRPQPDRTALRQIPKFKALLRKAAERAIEALWDRIGKLLDAFTAEECANYFRHDGYNAK